MNEHGLLDPGRHDQIVQATLAHIEVILDTYQPERAYAYIAQLVREVVVDVHRDVEGYYVERAYRQAVSNSTTVLKAVFSGWKRAKGETEE